jgi:hypothetical protein
MSATASSSTSDQKDKSTRGKTDPIPPQMKIRSTYLDPLMQNTTSLKRTHPLKEIQNGVESQIESIEKTIQNLN